jgi:hypothetical protein
MKNVLWGNLPRIALLMTVSAGVFLTMSTAVFAADGDVVDIFMQDLDVNGKIDTIGLDVTYANGTPGAGGTVCNNTAGALTGFVVTDAGTGLPITVASAAVIGGDANIDVCSVDITLTEGVNSSFDTSATAVDVVYTQGNFAVTDGVGPAAVAAILTGQVEVDEAAPSPVSATFYDATSSDGKLDLIVVDWSEDLTAVANAAAKWNLTSAANFAAVTEGTVECNSGSAGGSKCNYNFTTTTVKTNVGDLTLVYTALGGQITDGANAVAADKTFTSASVSPIPSFTDAAAPVYVSSSTLDNNTNGTVDYIKVTYSEPILDSSVAATDYKAYISNDDAGSLIETYTSLTPSSGTVTDVANDAIIYVGVTSGTVETITANKTDYALKIVQIGAVTDSVPNSYASFTVQTSTDGAAPIVYSSAYADSTNDGKIDQITLVYTESVTTFTMAGGDWNFGTAGDMTLAGDFADAECTGDPGATITCTDAGTGTVDADANETGIGLAGTAPVWTFTTSANVTDGTTNAPTQALTLSDAAQPKLVSAQLVKASNYNTLVVNYSEPIYVDATNQDGTIDAGDFTTSESTNDSTTSVGGLSAAAGGTATAIDTGTVENIGVFSVIGDYIPSAQTNNHIAIDATGKIMTVTFNINSGTYFVSGTTNPSGTFDAANASYVLAQAATATGYTLTGTRKVNQTATAPTTTVTSWDSTAPSTITGVLYGGITGAASNQAIIDWTAHATLADFSRYMLAYGTSAGVTVSNGTLWTSSNDATLSTNSTALSTITGLTNGTTYYVKVYAIDISGNISAASTEISYLLKGSSGNSGGDTVAPGIPTGLAATVNSNNTVNLIWVDPTDSDLSYIQIIRSKGTGVDPTSILTTVTKGVKNYTDTDVLAGDVVNYKLKAYDTSGNASSATSTVSLTVQTGATGEVTESSVQEETPTEETPAEPVTVTTESGEIVTLNDVSNHWGKDNITDMVSTGVIKGDPDGDFRPDDSLNRAEAAAMLYRTLGLAEPAAPIEAPFSDVAFDGWYAGYVTYLKDLDIITGNPDGSYKPANNINRAEFLKLALSTYYYIVDETKKAEIDGLEAGPMTDAYQDLKATDWYAPKVTAATELSFVSGKDCDGGKCFDAGADVTRAEATKILHGMFYDMLTQ